LSTSQLLALGALAGFTIFLGLPIGRIRTTDQRLKAALSAAATGILLFLLIEVTEHGVGPVEEALEGAVDDGKSWLDFAGLAALFVTGVSAGLMSLVYYDRWMGRQRNKALLGPGAASAAEFEPSWAASLSPARWLAVLIATGIGLHNFSEGLAIGNAAYGGELALALTLIVGFGAHNATEGFGIAAPLATEKNEKEVNLGLLALCGLIGGGPTLLGTLVGFSYTSELLSVLFLALAGGAVVFVVNELLGVGRKLGSPAWGGWGITLGFLAGFLTELILAYAGA
jgi:zinc transporter, ZIP family